MTGFVEDLSFDKALDVFRESLSEFELDEEFFRLVFLKTAGGSHNLFLDLFVERYEDWEFNSCRNEKFNITTNTDFKFFSMFADLSTMTSKVKKNYKKLQIIVELN